MVWKFKDAQNALLYYHSQVLSLLRNTDQLFSLLKGRREAY